MIERMNWLIEVAGYLMKEKLLSVIYTGDSLIVYTRFWNINNKLFIERKSLCEGAKINTQYEAKK